MALFRELFDPDNWLNYFVENVTRIIQFNVLVCFDES